MAKPIVISILTNASSAVAGLDATATKAEQVGAKFQSMALPATIALTAIAAVSKKAIDAASDLSEEVAKSGEVFGDQTASIKKFAEEAEQSLGQSERAALDATSTFGQIAQSAGLSGKGAADFATEFTTLASDLASFNNSTPEEAITAIGAALRGESEPIRRFGVMLDDATLRARAMSMGLIDNVKTALTPQQKALAASEEILAQTSKAQGDFARTSDGAANQARINAAETENLSAKLGGQLLPYYESLQRVLSQVLGWMSRHQTTTKVLVAAVAGLAAAVLAVNAVMKVAAAVTAVYNAVVGVSTARHKASLAATIATRVGQAALAVQTAAITVATKAAAAAQWLFNTAMAANPVVLVIAAIALLVAGLIWFFTQTEIGQQIITAVWDAIKTATQALVDAFMVYVNLIVSYWKMVWDGIKWVVDKVVGYYTFLITKGWELYNGIINAFTAAVDWVKGIPGKITDALGDLGSLLKDAGKKVIDGFVKGLEKGFDKVKDALGGLTNKLTSWKGPPERDAIILKDAGQLVIDGFITGLESRYGAVRKSLGGLTKDVARTSFDAPGIKGGAYQGEALSDAALARSLGGVVVHKTYKVEAHMLNPTPEAGRVIKESLDDLERLGG
ncbi:MAG: hypothetical protein P1U38_09865 [Aeromicrobium sp.]|uniref:phage tail protein n=1 Tax=Aeromicrobium sp. TaxID=1871063 RepID=UPI002622E4C8|nr:hypothetical protein [Aeromicrobium sp.]MDF1705068.1 hypothetical protein [Aeromicrobium sp.]